jgi:hypothetical protein
MGLIDQLPHAVVSGVAAAATGAAAAASGFGIWRILLWLTIRFDKRQAQLDAEHAALDMSWKDYRLLLERDRRGLQQRMTTMEKQGRALRMAFEHVAGALIRVDPDNPALAVVDKILAAAFPDDFTVTTYRAETALDRDIAERRP